MAETATAVSNPPADTLIRFLLPGAQTRGAIIRARNLHAEACRIHGLAGGEQNGPGELFTQSLVASMLLLSISKGGVRQVLQLDGTGGPITRILAETRSGAVRGYLDWNDGVSSLGSTQASSSSSPTGWLGSPINVSTVRDPGFGQPYVSSVQSTSSHLADILVDYINQSVQVRADVILHHDTGLMIEAMPGSGEEQWFAAVKAMAAIPDAALDDDPESVLEAFNDLGMKIVGRDDYRWQCSCDIERMARGLTGMDREALDELKDEQGCITVSCRYCGAFYSLKPGTD